MHSCCASGPATNFAFGELTSPGAPRARRTSGGDGPDGYEALLAAGSPDPVEADVDLSDGLALRVTEIAAASPFGAFAYLGGRRELWFQHAILGDDLDVVELEAAIGTVSAVADAWDDRLAGEFGGLRYADLG